MYRNPFTAELRCNDHHRLGEDIVCTFTITNTHRRELYLLKRNTPFEGLLTDFVTISRDGNKIQYDSKVLKRGAHSKDDFICFKVDERKSVDIDLTSAYHIHTAAEYRVSLNTTALFSVDGDTSPDKLRSQQLKSPVKIIRANTHIKPKKTLGQQQRENDDCYDSGASSDHPIAITPVVVEDGNITKDMVIKAYSKAFEKVQHAPKWIDTQPDLYKEYFGSAAKDSVKKFYQRIKNAMSTRRFRFEYHSGPIDGESSDNVYAYTHYGSTTIYLCRQYITAKDEGYDTKYGTIVHEMTHAVDYTEDIDYGEENAEKLAKHDPSQAANNADNYEYFVESCP